MRNAKLVIFYIFCFGLLWIIVFFRIGTFFTWFIRSLIGGIRRFMRKYTAVCCVLWLLSVLIVNWKQLHAFCSPRYTAEWDVVTDVYLDRWDFKKTDMEKYLGVKRIWAECGPRWHLQVTRWLNFWAASYNLSDPATSWTPEKRGYFMWFGPCWNLGLGWYDFHLLPCVFYMHGLWSDAAFNLKVPPLPGRTWLW